MPLQPFGACSTIVFWIIYTGNLVTLDGVDSVVLLAMFRSTRQGCSLSGFTALSSAPGPLAGFQVPGKIGIIFGFVLKYIPQNLDCLTLYKNDFF